MLWVLKVFRGFENIKYLGYIGKNFALRALENEEVIDIRHLTK